VLDKQIEAIRSISSLEAVVAGAAFIGVIAPGYLGLLVFAPNLLLELSFITTLFLSISFSVPILLPFVMTVGGSITSDEQMNQALFFSIAVSSFPFYIWLLVAATFGFSWQIFVWILVVIEAGLAWYIWRYKKGPNEEAS